MGVECAVISGIFVLFTVVCICTKRRAWAWASLPLLPVPLTDFVIEYLLINVMKIKVTAFAAVLALIIAVAASAVWIGLYSGYLDHKRYKATYIGITNAFNIALAAIIISDIFSRASLDAEIPIGINILI